MKSRDDLLKIVANITDKPKGAFNIRENGGLAGRRSTENVIITSKEDKSGIDITVKSSARNETVYIPAIITREDVNDLVYNDFFIEDGASVTIVAGCGVHNDGCSDSVHNGIHRFFVGKGAEVLYIEKHIGTGEGTGKRIINPETYAEVDVDGRLTMDTVQIGGVDSTVRKSKAKLSAGAKLIIKEKLMTHGEQTAETYFEVDLDGEDSGADLVSRSVARGNSKQKFVSIINGNAKCSGHSECDAIIMDESNITALPQITANCTDAMLIHEAAIGKIAGEQIIKLMKLGLTEAEAEAKIVEGFLK